VPEHAILVNPANPATATRSPSSPPSAWRSRSPSRCSRRSRSRCPGMPPADRLPGHHRRRRAPARGEPRHRRARLRALADTPSPGLRALFEEAGLRPPCAPTTSPSASPRGSTPPAGSDRPTRPRAAARARARSRARAGRPARPAQPRAAGSSRAASSRRPASRSERAARHTSAWPGARTGIAASWHRGGAAGPRARPPGRPAGGRAGARHRLGPQRPRHPPPRLPQAWTGRLVRFGGHAQAVGLTANAGPRGARPGVAGGGLRVGPRRPRAGPALRPRARSGGGRREPARQIERLEPFGAAIPSRCCASAARAGRGVRRFGATRLRDRCRDRGGPCDRAYGWSWGDRLAVLAGRIEALACLERDRWRGGAAPAPGRPAHAAPDASAP